MMELTIGQRFGTDDEADKFIHDYARAGYYPIRRCKHEIFHFVLFLNTSMVK